jgi:hypothetical protein
MTGLSPGRSRPWRLGARARKGVLVVHIVSAGAWIGINVVMGVLVFTALLAERGSTRALCYRALELFAVWPPIVAGLLCLAGGGVLGLGTKWGLVRYWWVVIKLVLNVVLVSLVPLLLRPQVVEMAERGRRFVAGEAASLAVGDLVFPPIVSPRAPCPSPSCWLCSSRGAQSASARRREKGNVEPNFWPMPPPLVPQYHQSRTLRKESRDGR